MKRSRARSLSLWLAVALMALAAFPVAAPAPRAARALADTWTQTEWTTPFTSLAVAMTPRGPTLYAGAEGSGLWASAAPYEAWQQIKGLRAGEVNFVLPGWAATTDGVYVAAGGRWRMALRRPDVVCMALLDDGALVAGTAGGGVWHATA